MTPHPRIRKTIKWGGAAASACLIGAFVASAWWSFRWTSGHGNCLAVWMNQLEISHTLVSPGSRILDKGLRFYDHRVGGMPPYFNLGFRLGGTSSDWWFAIPMWLPAVFSILISALAWRLDTLARRRARAHLCPKCGYDRSGLVAGAVCPECGKGAA
jgi:hypothetical protein